MEAFVESLRLGVYARPHLLGRAHGPSAAARGHSLLIFIGVNRFV